MTKIETYYQGDDIPITIGPLYLETDIEKTSPIDISALAQVLIRTGTDPRFVAEGAKVPGTGQVTLTFPTPQTATFTVQSEQSRLMKVGFATVEVYLSQTDNSLTDLKRDSSGEDIKYQILEHTLNG